MVAREHVPSWLHVPHITSGYAIPTKSAKSLLFSIHNQTINAWSIMFSAIVSIALYIWLLTNHKLDNTQFIVFTSFLISCIIHTPFSVANHILRHQGKLAYSYWKSMDIMFIFIASIFLTFSLSFFIFPLMITMGLVALSIFIAIYAYRNMLNNKYYGLGAKTNKTKHIMCVLMAIVPYIIPIIYGAIVRPELRKLAYGIIATLFLCGVIYGTAIPERFFPATFDIVGASHQILHIGVLLAHVMEFIFIGTASSTF